MSEELEASQNDAGKQTQKLGNPHGAPEKRLNLKGLLSTKHGLGAVVHTAGQTGTEARRRRVQEQSQSHTECMECMASLGCMISERERGQSQNSLEMSQLGSQSLQIQWFL